MTLFICLRTKLADELLINLNLSLHAVKMIVRQINIDDQDAAS